MLIKKITLKNFQIHKQLTLELDNFTAIVGPSSAGKSSVLRALSWLFYGDWDKTYSNDPEKETAVAIQLEDGTIWARFRKGNRNWAMVRKPGQKAIPYNDFGDYIPGLLEELNVRVIKIGTSKVNLNFSMQDDPIFMVHESKPTKAQWIGRLYGAHIINQMLRLMSKDKRDIESEKTIVEDADTKMRSELDKYIGLDEQTEAIERTGQLIDRLEQMLACRSMLLEVMKDSEAIKKGSHIINADTSGLRVAVERLRALLAVQDAYLGVKREEKALDGNPCLEANTGQIKADLQRLQEAQGLLDAFRKLAEEMDKTQREHKKVKEDLEKDIIFLDNSRKTMKDSLFAEGRCPLCHSKPRKLDMAVVMANLKELVRSA